MRDIDELARRFKQLQVDADALQSRIPTKADRLDMLGVLLLALAEASDADGADCETAGAPDEGAGPGLANGREARAEASAPGRAKGVNTRADLGEKIRLAAEIAAGGDPQKQDLIETMLQIIEAKGPLSIADMTEALRKKKPNANVRVRLVTQLMAMPPLSELRKPSGRRPKTS